MLYISKDMQNYEKVYPRQVTEASKFSSLIRRTRCENYEIRSVDISLPHYLTEIFINTNSEQDHNTRYSKFNVALLNPKTNNMKKAFAYRKVIFSHLIFL